MKFKKVVNEYLYPKYIREDEKVVIASCDRHLNGILKSVFEVTDEKGNVLDIFMRLKDAKATYSEV